MIQYSTLCLRKSCAAIPVVKGEGAGELKRPPPNYCNRLGETLMMNPRAQLNANTSGRQSAGERHSIVRSKRGRRLAYRKESEKLTTFYAAKFHPRPPEELSVAERTEVQTAFAKLRRKWAI